jgi:hydrogenase small subunit
VLSLLTRFIDLVFHPDLSLATGHQVFDVMEKAINDKRKIIFVFEGSIPTALPHACLLGHRPVSEWVGRLAGRATVCIAAGTCASFGGITRMPSMSTGCMPLGEYVASQKIATPVVNLPNCPMKPEHLVYMLLYYARFNGIPELDEKHRPIQFFKQTIHQQCIYYRAFQENNFAERIGDEGCMFHLGCQGPISSNDCLIAGHNANTNSCIRSGHPCIGCASETFPRKIMLHARNESRSLEWQE